MKRVLFTGWKSGGLGNLMEELTEGHLFESDSYRTLIELKIQEIGAFEIMFLSAVMAEK